MLPAINRLKGEKAFKEVFERGRWEKLDFLRLKTIGNNLNYSRFGFIVSKKVSKKATVRNKTKRILSEIIKELLPRLKKGLDVALMAESGIEKREFRDISECLKTLFEKAKLFK